jgi:hypothetical protein
MASQSAYVGINQYFSITNCNINGACDTLTSDYSSRSYASANLQDHGIKFIVDSGRLLSCIRSLTRLACYWN